MSDLPLTPDVEKWVRTRTFWVTVIVFSLLGPVAAFAKQGTVPLLILLMLAHPNLNAIVLSLKSILKTPLVLALLALIAWCFVTLLWAEALALMTLARLCLVGLMGFMAITLIASLNDGTKKKLSIVVVASVVFLLAVLLFEGLSNAALHKLLRPEDTVPRDGEWVPYLEMVAARGTAILAPFSFVAAALLARLTGRPYLGVALMALTLVATSLLPMDASTLAVLCGCLGYLLVRFRPKVMTKLLFAATILLAITSPFIMSSVLTQDNLADQGIELTRNQTQRVAIWNYASDLIREKPMLGYGFDSSREIGKQGVLISGTNWPAMPLHPHNAFLQIWLELGLVGICLVGVFLGFLWRQLDFQIEENRETPIIIATIVAALVISLISFGVWQYWWIATWAFLACGIQLTKTGPP